MGKEIVSMSKEIIFDADKNFVNRYCDKNKN